MPSTSTRSLFFIFLFSSLTSSHSLVGGDGGIVKAGDEDKDEDEDEDEHKGEDGNGRDVSFSSPST